MTEEQAAELQVKWNQQGNPPPSCEHLNQEVGHVAKSDNGYVTSTYHCRKCGEEIVRTYKAITTNILPID